MTQRKDTRHPRRGSENRQRTKAVLVRLTPAEHDVLTGAAERAGKGAATMLREAFTGREACEDLLGDISLYVPWRYVTLQLTTPQKEMWADAVEAWSARLNAGTEETTIVDRWWRDTRPGDEEGQ